MQAVKRSNESIVIALIISVLILLGLAACANRPTVPGDGTSQPSESNPTEASTASHQREPRQAKRCGPMFYSKVAGSGDYDPVCYDLQLKLINAAREGDLAGMKEALDNGANPEGSVYNHYPPLHTAAAGGQSDAVRLLLDSGAQVNRVTDFENTPLNMAASYGHTNVVRMLLDGKADVCYRSAAGTAGDIARSQGYNELADLLKATEARNCR